MFKRLHFRWDARRKKRVLNDLARKREEEQQLQAAVQVSELTVEDVEWLKEMRIEW